MVELTMRKMNYQEVWSRKTGGRRWGPL